MTLTQMVIAAMQAGLRGERCPNLGDRLTMGELSLINSVYEEARNWRAGEKAKERTR